MSDSLPVCSETFELGSAVITLETGKLARQADASVVVRERKTMLLATVVSEPLQQVSEEPFLTVEYRERAAAAGRIPGNYFRRELRPGEHEILLNRTIDRSLRPAIPKFYDRSLQVLVTVFSADPDSDIPSLSLLGASAALALSRVPLTQLVVGARFVRVEEEVMALFRPEHARATDMDLFVVLASEGVVALDGQAERLPLGVLHDAMKVAKAELEPALDAIQRLRKAVDPLVDDMEVKPFDTGLVEGVRRFVEEALASEKPSRRVWRDVVQSARERALLELSDASDSSRVEHKVGIAFDGELRRAMREQILAGKRLDGRAANALRDLAAEVGVLPMNHGSALFNRGETQALVSATLGRLGEGQNTEFLWGQKTSHFLLHYNFPGYATGKVARFRAPGFREYGHGHLARKAFLPLLPNPKRFGKTIRVVSEITESAGSSSMATVCGASLAMVEAGVPLAEHVAGVAMGLVRDSENTVILSDITGDEDACGDMDLKVAGSASGLTSLQLDSKHGPVPLDVLEQAMRQASVHLREILEVMNGVLDPAEPQEVERTVEAAAQQATPSLRYQVPSSSIGRVIGAKGRNIRAIEATFSIQMKVNNDGIVTLQGEDVGVLRAARHQVRAFLLPLQKQKAYLSVVTDVSEEGVRVRVGDHQGWLSREELGQASEGLQTGSELVVTPVGSDGKGRLLLGHQDVATLAPKDALNYVSDSEECQ